MLFRSGGPKPRGTIMSFPKSNAPGPAPIPPEIIEPQKPATPPLPAEVPPVPVQAVLPPPAAKGTIPPLAAKTAPVSETKDATKKGGPPNTQGNKGAKTGPLKLRR